jgi:hypothetical protein
MVVGGIVVALAATGTAVAATDGGKATGGITITTSAGYQAHRSFTAQGTPTRAKGQIETKLTDPVTGKKVGQFHGVVDCYRQTGPNSAIFGGHITHFQGKSGDVQGFQPFFEWAVVDNGEGPMAPPDMFGAGRFRNAPDCDAGDVLPVQPVEHGNIQVKADS